MSNGVSSSTLKKWLTMPPNEVIWHNMNPPESSQAKELGKLVHALLLEPDRAPTVYAVMPNVDKRTKAGKAEALAWEKENEGKIHVTKDQETQALAMVESCRNHEAASLLLQDTINESSVYWWYRKRDDADDRDYKQLCKVRPDATSMAYPMLIDIKTTDDASYDAFQKSVVKYHYHLSAAMYLNGVNQCDALRKETCVSLYKYFVFIVLGKNPAWDSASKKMTYNTAVYSLDPQALQMGDQLYRYAMKRLYDAKQDDYPGLPGNIRDLDLPSWAKKIPTI